MMHVSISADRHPKSRQHNNTGEAPRPKAGRQKCRWQETSPLLPIPSLIRHTVIPSASYLTEPHQTPATPGGRTQRREGGSD